MFFSSSITRIICLTERPASFNKRIHSSSSLVILRLVERNRTSKGLNNSWLCYVMNSVIYHSLGKISNDFFKVIRIRALHPHLTDFLFLCSLDESTSFNRAFPSHWQQKSRRFTSPFFLSVRSLRIENPFLHAYFLKQMKASSSLKKHLSIKDQTRFPWNHLSLSSHHSTQMYFLQIATLFSRH